MQHLIVQHQDTQIFSQQAAREGTLSLRQAGWVKVLQGITSIEEVTAMTHP